MSHSGGENDATRWLRWIKSKGSRQVHGSRTLSTSRMQFGGTHETGGGKRSTPRTVAVDILVRCFPGDIGDQTCRDTPFGNMSATSLE